jgi:hypothetical protein
VPPSRVHAAPRKSYFVYFHLRLNMKILIWVTWPHSHRMRSGSHPEDIRNMPSKGTFSAVLHRKVRGHQPRRRSLMRNHDLCPERHRRGGHDFGDTIESWTWGVDCFVAGRSSAERYLNKGELPSEEIQQSEDRAKEAAAAEVQAKAKTKNTVV